jgi:hypothetical protein
MEALFSQLQQGEGITAGLKKVDKSEMTHKNPALRGSGESWPPVSREWGEGDGKWVANRHHPSQPPSSGAGQERSEPCRRISAGRQGQEGAEDGAGGQQVGHCALCLCGAVLHA